MQLWPAKRCFGQLWTASMTTVPSNYDGMGMFLFSSDVRAVIAHCHSTMHSSRVCGDAGVHTYHTASHVKVWHTHSCTVHDTQ